ncbi:MAG: flagellar hook-associated protein FlgK [Alphaproteobacteria bacterium]|nr:flagellar hook-associated protein FlgK [Alphaproteobacteria bacterium]
MGLGQSISNTLSGLRATQAGIDVVSRNVSNAETEGYTKKIQTLNAKISGGKGTGVAIGPVTRQVDSFLQTNLRVEYSDYKNLSVQTEFLEYVDNLFGEPGSDGALDSIVNNVASAMTTFANAPQSKAASQELMEGSEYLVSQLRDMSDGVQDMRQSAESMIGQEIDRANVAINNIARISHQLISNGSGNGLADLQDQLDMEIEDLAAIINIKVVPEGTNGAVKIFAANGLALVDGRPGTLQFDTKFNLSANHLYNKDKDLRGVGTIGLLTASGKPVDLIETGAIRSGKLAGLINVRDNILVNAQDQLDELAHSLAMALNTIENKGTAVVTDVNTGFNLDISGLSDGNVIEFDYRDNLTGYSYTMSFVKVSDPTTLPLDDSATAKGNDKVYGIDFSGGMASVEAQIADAIAKENPNFSVSLIDGTHLQIMDDGGSNLVNVAGLTGMQTARGVQGQGTELNFFVDWNGNRQENYSNSLDGNTQKRGFASRIRVNSELLADNGLLVKYSNATALGDQSRPEDLLAKFTETSFAFNADSGIGSKSSPYSGTLVDFAQKVVANQTSQIARHSDLEESQKMVVSAMNARLSDKTKVNVDEEMAQLLTLQMAYAANARVVSVVKDLMDIIRNM